MKYQLSGGWGGGEHLIDGVLTPPEDIARFSLYFEKKIYPLHSERIDGYDMDHGHKYTWVATRFYVKEPSALRSCNKVFLHELLAGRRKYLALIRNEAGQSGKH